MFPLKNDLMIGNTRDPIDIAKLLIESSSTLLATQTVQVKRVFATDSQRHFSLIFSSVF